MLNLTPSSTVSPVAAKTPSGTLPPGTGTEAKDRIPTPPPAEEGPLAGLPDATATTTEVDPALQPQAAVFLTPHGRTLMEQISTFQSYVELPTAADLHARVELAADALAALPGRGVLLLSGAHHAPSSLTQFHAAVDACSKHGWPLLAEIQAGVFEQMKGLARFLEAEPRLRQLLGKVPLSSRAGQQIAWNYVRQSGDRGALQQFLPEVLACIDIRRSGVRLVHVDDLGLHGGSDRQREASMVRNSHAALPKDGKGALVLGLAHAMPMHERFRVLGVTCSEVAVLDESANHAHRHFDAAEEGNPTYHNAVTHSRNLRLPDFSLAASRTDAYRMPPDFSPFR